MKVVCVKACFYKSQLFKPGMSVDVPGSKAPKHFEAANKVKKVPAKKPVKELNTLKEIQDQNKKEEGML